MRLPAQLHQQALGRGHGHHRGDEDAVQEQAVPNHRRQHVGRSIFEGAGKGSHDEGGHDGDSGGAQASFPGR